MWVGVQNICLCFLSTPPYFCIFNLCRLDEKFPAKKTATSNVRKNEQYVVENVIFETKVEKKVEESKTKPEYKPLELKKQPLEDTTNELKDKVKTVEEFQAL